MHRSPRRCVNSELQGVLLQPMLLKSRQALKSTPLCQQRAARDAAAADAAEVQAAVAICGDRLGPLGAAEVNEGLQLAPQPADGVLLLGDRAVTPADAVPGCLQVLGEPGATRL